MNKLRSFVLVLFSAVIVVPVWSMQDQGDMNFFENKLATAGYVAELAGGFGFPAGKVVQIPGTPYHVPGSRLLCYSGITMHSGLRKVAERATTDLVVWKMKEWAKKTTGWSVVIDSPKKDSQWPKTRTVAKFVVEDVVLHMAAVIAAESLVTKPLFEGFDSEQSSSISLQVSINK